jgi:hypothetical protein
MSFPPGTEIFQFPGFASLHLFYSVNDTSSKASSTSSGLSPEFDILASEVGFPIRKSAGQRLFAPHRSLSQRTTSFIASCHQGIHEMPLSRLIALIINARSAAESLMKKRPDHAR